MLESEKDRVKQDILKYILASWRAKGRDCPFHEKLMSELDTDPNNKSNWDQFLQSVLTYARTAKRARTDLLKAFPVGLPNRLEE